jgi:hypothetical protein
MPLSWQFALSTDAKGNCELGPITLHPVSTVDDEDCDDNHPKLDVKIISVNKDELKIYFSIDGGKTYYNEEDPRRAIRIPDHDDADGTNSSGGSSSKGGKKGTNDDRRKLVEKTLKEARKLDLDIVLCGTQQRGENCHELSGPFCDGLECVGWKSHGTLGTETTYGKCECKGHHYCAKDGEYCNVLFGPWCTDGLTCLSFARTCW